MICVQHIGRMTPWHYHSTSVLCFISKTPISSGVFSRSLHWCLGDKHETVEVAGHVAEHLEWLIHQSWSVIGIDSPQAALEGAVSHNTGTGREDTKEEKSGRGASCENNRHEIFTHLRNQLSLCRRMTVIQTSRVIKEGAPGRAELSNLGVFLPDKWNHMEFVPPQT